MAERPLVGKVAVNVDVAERAVAFLRCRARGVSAASGLGVCLDRRLLRLLDSDGGISKARPPAPGYAASLAVERTAEVERYAFRADPTGTAEPWSPSYEAMPT